MNKTIFILFVIILITIATISSCDRSPYQYKRPDDNKIEFISNTPLRCVTINGHKYIYNYHGGILLCD